MYCLFGKLLNEKNNERENKRWTEWDKTLGDTGIMLAIVKEIYRDCLAYVRVGKYPSNPIIITNVLIFGCSLVSLIFNLDFEVVLKNWKQRCRYMRINNHFF